MRVGITGHQDLGSNADRAWILSHLVSQIEKPELKSGFTSLAIGADQLFASLLRKQGKPYTAIIPCEGYEETFQTQADLETYRSLLSGSFSVVQLPFSHPSEQAFWEAGKNIVEASDYMIAIWNGLPPRGLGGTADVVRYSLEQGKKVIHINPKQRSVIEKVA